VAYGQVSPWPDYAVSGWREDGSPTSRGTVFLEMCSLVRRAASEVLQKREQLGRVLVGLGENRHAALLEHLVLGEVRGF